MWCVFDHHPGVAGYIKDAVATFNAEYRVLIVQIGCGAYGRKFDEIRIAWRNGLKPVAELGTNNSGGR